MHACMHADLLSSFVASHVTCSSATKQGLNERSALAQAISKDIPVSLLVPGKTEDDLIR